MPAKVTVRPVMVRGVKMWRVRRIENGKPKRTFFDTQTKALSERKRLELQQSRAGKIWLSLPAHEQEQLILAYTLAKERGIDLQSALMSAQDNVPQQSPTLINVIGDLIDAKRKAGRSEDYTDTLENVLTQFATMIGDRRKFHTLTVHDVERFLDAKKLASRSTLRSRLSTMFKFGIRRGHRTDNPCERLEAITTTRKPPAVFTVKQFEAAAKWLLASTTDDKKCLAWFALTTVCGLRPEEAEKTDEKRDINFKEGFIRVEAQTTKVRQRRVVYPKHEAMLFLKWTLKHGGVLPIDPQVRQRMISGKRWKNVSKGFVATEGLRGALGFDQWPKDITRHTAASYWLADCGSTATVSEALGNSEKVLRSHYKAVVTRKEAKAFWAMVKNMATVKVNRSRGDGQ
jgi:site-specific recombinase XerC